MSIELSLTIIAVFIPIGVVIAVLDFLARLSTDRFQRKSMDAVRQQQQTLIDNANQHWKDWRSVVEQETGKPFEQVTDAEILQIVRRDDDVAADP